MSIISSRYLSYIVKSCSNAFLDTTSTKGWGWSVLLKWTTGAFNGIRTYASQIPTDYESDALFIKLKTKKHKKNSYLKLYTAYRYSNMYMTIKNKKKPNPIPVYNYLSSALLRLQHHVTKSVHVVAFQGLVVSSPWLTVNILSNR